MKLRGKTEAEETNDSDSYGFLCIDSLKAVLQDIGAPMKLRGNTDTEETNDSDSYREPFSFR